MDTYALVVVSASDPVSAVCLNGRDRRVLTNPLTVELRQGFEVEATDFLLVVG